MRDRLAFRYDEGEDLVQRYRRFTMLPVATQRDIWTLAVQKDDEKTIAVALGVMLSGKGIDSGSLAKIMHLEDIIATNGFAIHMDTETPGGLYLNASRINHSCIPNADQASQGSDDCHKLVGANRDIAAGEEITTSYIAHFLPCEARQALLGRWGFACRCPGCDPSHPLSRSHERCLDDFHRLCQDPCLDNAGSVLRLRSDFGDAIKLLEFVIEADKIYYGAVALEHERVYDGLQRGDITGV